MEFYIKEKLDQIEHDNILIFLSSIDYYCIEQHPDWDYETGGRLKKFFYCTVDNQDIRCFAVIVISKNGPFRIAYINFGPAFDDYNILTKSVEYLHDYFSEQGFIYFSIQLGTYINDKTELLEYTIAKNYKVKYYFRPGNLWSSLTVDLTRSETDIFGSISKGHKNNIKTCYKKGLRMIIQNDITNFNLFIDLYIKMLVFRKLTYNKNGLISELTNIFTFINKYNKGFVGYIFEKEVMVGALIIIFQGKTARYFKSTSDPERRDLPVMHLGIFEAIKYCKENGFSAFDLWGYNHFVTEEDQIFKINIFKKGFTDNYTFFPKRMNFELKPFVHKVFICLKFIKNGIANILIRRSIS